MRWIHGSAFPHRRSRILALDRADVTRLLRPWRAEREREAPPKRSGARQRGQEATPVSTTLAKERERESMLFEPIDVSLMSSMPGEIPGLLPAMGFLDCFAVPLCCTVYSRLRSLRRASFSLNALPQQSGARTRRGRLAGGTSFCP